MNTSSNPQVEISTEVDCEAEDNDHDWEFRDDSFDHEYGTETVHYWECSKCHKTRDVESNDYCED